MIYIIILILGSMALLANSTDTLKTYNMGEVIVKDKDSPLLEASSFTKISAVELQRKQILNVADALANESALYIRKNSRNESVLNMRGFNQRQISVFIDGVPIYPAFDGQIDLSNFTVNGISDINIIKGLPSIQYGANGMAGTVNIVSFEGKQAKLLNSNLHYGSNEKSFSMNHGKSFGDFFWNIALNYAESDGYQLSYSFSENDVEDGGVRNMTEFKNIGVFLKTGYNISQNHRVSLSYYRTDNEKEIPLNIYSKWKRYKKFSDWNKSISNLQYRGTLNWISFKLNSYFVTFYNVLDSYDDETMTTQTMKYTFHSTYDDYTYGTNLISNIDNQLISPTKFIFSFKSDVHRESDNTDLGFEKFEATTMTVGLEQDYSLNDLSFVGGLSYDYLNPNYANGEEMRDTEDFLNSYFGVVYKFNKEFSLHTNVSNKNRFPTLKELYADVLGQDIRNPDLKSEEALNYELGCKFIIKNFSVNSAIFYSDITNLINQVTFEDNSRQYQNIGKSHYKGFEISSDYSLESIKTKINYTYLSAENTAKDADSKILEYKPRHNFNWIMEYSLPFDLTFRSSIHFSGYIQALDFNNRIYVRVPDYFLWDLIFRYEILNDFDIYMKANNILDKYYESEWGFPQAGRSFGIGLSYR